MGARLRARGFAPGAGDSRQGCQSDCGSGAELACSSGIVPGHLLVFLAPCAGQKPVPRHWAQGNGIPENMKSQGQWLHFLKTDSCWSCHQMGDKATREIPKSLGHFDLSTAAWARRLLSGQAGNNMINGLAQLGPERALPMFADWTDRLAAGELPPTPPRPQGVERNVVISEWDWADPKAYLHDEIATDRRNPSLNANGLIYGAPELSRDYLPALDPAGAMASQVKVPVRDPKTPSSADDKLGAPSPYWGDEAIWHSQANVHNPMFDGKGRVWITSRIRPSDNPAFCKEEIGR